MSAQLAEHTMLTTLRARLVLLSGMGKARALKHYEDMKVRVVCPKVFIHLSLNFEQRVNRWNIHSHSVLLTPFQLSRGFTLASSPLSKCLEC